MYVISPNASYYVFLSSNVIYRSIGIDRIDSLTDYANKFYKRFRHDIETISVNVCSGLSDS